MGFKLCFPDLPGGECWPPDGGAVFRGCFPSPESRPARGGRAPHNKRVKLPGARKAERLGHGWRRRDR